MRETRMGNGSFIKLSAFEIKDQKLIAGAADSNTTLTHACRGGPIQTLTDEPDSNVTLRDLPASTAALLGGLIPKSEPSDADKSPNKNRSNPPRMLIVQNRSAPLSENQMTQLNNLSVNVQHAYIVYVECSQCLEVITTMILKSFVDDDEKAKHPAISNSQPEKKISPDKITVKPTISAGAPTLTPREREILTLYQDKLMSSQIASRLGVTVETLRTHRKNILRKTGFHSISEAAERMK